MTVGIKRKVLLHYNVDLYHFNLKTLCFSRAFPFSIQTANLRLRNHHEADN